MRYVMLALESEVKISDPTENAIDDYFTLMKSL